MFGSEGGAAAAFYVFGQVVHRIPSDGQISVINDGGFGFVDGRENFGSAALAFFPQREGFFHGVFALAEATTVDSLANEGLLDRC